VIQFIFFHVHPIDVNEGAVYIPIISWDSRRASLVVILLRWFSGGQIFSIWTLTIHPRQSRCDHPLSLLLPVNLAVNVSVSGIPIRQSTAERGSVSPPGHHRSPTSPASSRTGSLTFSYPTASLSPLSKQLSTSSSSSGGAHVRWNTASANGGGSVLSGEASEAGLDPTQVHYVTSYTAAEL
jgi:hypothetical protein